MKRTLLSFAIALFFGISVLTAQAQQNVAAKAYAEVISALTATETSQLNFGRFSPEVQGGQITVSPDGLRTANGSVILSGGTSQAGVFYITGAPEATFSVQLPAAPAILTHQSSNKTMVVTNWISTPMPGNATGVLVNGQQFVHLGATLLVSSILDNPVGLYSGSYTVTFAYN